MKNLILTILTLAVSWNVFGAAPVQRNPWTTNVTGNAVRGNNNLSVTNLTSTTNWLFYGVQAATVARLTDITNHGSALFAPIGLFNNMTNWAYGASNSIVALNAETNNFVLKAGDTMTGALHINGPTVTDPAPALRVGSTWNDAADTHSGLVVNVTNTASAANSLLGDFQVAAASKLGIRKDGAITKAGTDGFFVENVTQTAGNAKGIFAVDLQTYRTAAANVASGAYSSVLGGGHNKSSGILSISGGQNCTASGQTSVALGESCTASTFYSVAIGNQCSSSAQGPAFGVQSSTVLNGQLSHSAGMFASVGDAQMAVLVARRVMTIATSTVTNLTNDAGSGYLLVPNDTSWTFRILVNGRSVAKGAQEDVGAYEINGCISRDANAGTTRIVGTPTVVEVAEDQAGWGVAVSADTANGALTITATGDTDATIRWVATVFLTQTGG